MSISPSFHCPATAPLCFYSSQPIAQSQCCMQIGRTNCIVQPSLLRIVEHGENTPSSRSQVFCVLFCIGGGCSAEYCIREHESEGCVSLSGGAEHRLKAAVKCCCSCKGCEHKCSSRQFGRCCVFCQIFSETASRLVCYLCRPCAEARSPRARAS